MTEFSIVALILLHLITATDVYFRLSARRRKMPERNFRLRDPRTQLVIPARFVAAKLLFSVIATVTSFALLKIAWYAILTIFLTFLILSAALIAFSSSQRLRRPPTR